MSKEVFSLTSIKTSTVQQQTSSAVASVIITSQQQNEPSAREKQASEREHNAMEHLKQLESLVDKASPDLFPAPPIKLPGVDVTLHEVFERLTKQEESAVSKCPNITSCHIH